jgi:hypothetical protein
LSDETVVQEKGEEKVFLDKAPIKFFWPSTTEASDRLVKIPDWKDGNLTITVQIGEKQYCSDILMNVEQDEDDEAISFNVKALCGATDVTTPFKLIGDILFVDQEDMKIALYESDCVHIGDKLLYMPKDLYFTIDFSSGDCVFKNAKKNSDLYVKYLAFFLISQDDYNALYPVKKPLTPEEKQALTYKAIDGFDTLSAEQQEEVKKILDKILYNEGNPKFEQFETDFNPAIAPEQAPTKIQIPLKEDGTVDIEDFTRRMSSYAEEQIDFSKIEYEKTNSLIPYITKTDITQLGYIGFAPKDITGYVETARQNIIDSSEVIDTLTEKLEGYSEQYKNSYASCLDLITRGVYDSTKYDPTIKNLYEVLGMYQEDSQQLEKAKELLLTGQKTLASFQTVSRDHIKKSLENGEFTNKHTFMSIYVYTKALKDAEVISEDAIEKVYSVYNTYLKYINVKFKELNSYHYFSEMMINAYDPGRDNSIYSVSKDLFTRTIRFNDLRKVADEEAKSRLMERIQDRIHYAYDISYYPIAVASRYFGEIVDMLSFAGSPEIKAEYELKQQEFLQNLREKKWPLENLEIPEREGKITTIIADAQKIRDKLNNPEIIEAITGFFKMMRPLFSEHLYKLSNKTYKTLSDYFKAFVVYSLAMKIAVILDAVVLKEDKFIDDKKQVKEVKLSDNEVKVYIGKFFIELASYAIFMGSSLRLSNLISDRSTKYDINNENDAQTFFSVIFNGLTIPVEVLENAFDKGAEANEEGLDIIAPDIFTMLGRESTKVFYSGLKGEKEGNSNLFLGRQDVMKESIIFTENVFGLVNDFIDELTPKDE